MVSEVSVHVHLALLLWICGGTVYHGGLLTSQWPGSREGERERERERREREREKGPGSKYLQGNNCGNLSH
jgi:hypothetical protein